MTGAKKAAAIIALVIGGLYVTVYVTARLAQPSIELETRRYVLEHAIKGLAFNGRDVPPEEIEVTSEVQWPFVVEGSFLVPFGMHVSFHTTTYLILPWGRRVLARTTVTPL